MDSLKVVSTIAIVIIALIALMDYAERRQLRNKVLADMQKPCSCKETNSTPAVTGDATPPIVTDSGSTATRLAATSDML